MGIGYFFKAGATLQPQGGSLYEKYPKMREWCDQVADWTGMTGPEMLSQDASGGDPLYLSMLNNVVVSLGIVDILAEAGIRPLAVGGFCGGIMPAACVAGGIERKDLIMLIGRLTEMSTVDVETAERWSRSYGMAQLAFPEGTPDSHIQWFYGDEWPGVHLAADAGLIVDGSYRIITVSGQMDDLERLVTHMPRMEQVKLYDTYAGMHSPAYRPVQEFMEPHVRAITLQDPTMPLFSGLARGPIATAEELADAFVRFYTDPVWLDHLRLGLRQAGVRLTIAPGPGSPQRMSFLQWPFEVVEVQTPEDVTSATSAIQQMWATATPTERGSPLRPDRRGRNHRIPPR